MGRNIYKVPNWIKKKIVAELYHYWDNQKELKELQDDILESSSSLDGQSISHKVSNPTEQKALKLCTTRSILAVQRRINYITNAINRLDSEEKQVFEIIFKEKLSQKVAETNKYISKNTYYFVYHKIIFFTAQEFGDI